MCAPRVSPFARIKWTTMFERQALHWLLLGLLLAGLLSGTAQVCRDEAFLAGSCAGLSTAAWFWMAIAFPVAHQTYVWLCWRLELHKHWFTRHLGETGFRLYTAGFAFLGLGRLVVLIGLGIANQNTLAVDETSLDVLATLLLLPAVYLFYSVARYFTFKRALGIDHFDPSYRTKPLVREGIFRYTSNGMYTFGFLAVWLPGLYTASQAALLAALFSHVYIWVHYYCTELPDMKRIYGGATLSDP
jgi:hypothetical protein